MEFDINNASPTSLRQCIGQAKAIEQISVALDASHQDNLAFPHALMVGPSSAGKSLLARVISNEMASDCYEVLGQCLKTHSDLNGFLLNLDDKSVGFIDECHLLPAHNQTLLFQCIDKQQITIGSKTKAPQHLPLKDFSLILATTEEFLVLEPLRNRVKLTIRLDYYDEPDLMKIIHHRAKALGWDIHEKVIPAIAFRSRGIPRVALNLLQSCFRCCRSLGESTITMGHFLKPAGSLDRQSPDPGAPGGGSPFADCGRSRNQWIRAGAHQPARYRLGGAGFRL